MKEESPCFATPYHIRNLVFVYDNEGTVPQQDIEKLESIKRDEMKEV